jgi:hypothetical protein
MSIRFGISMTCFSFAKLLRARKFFWISDAMAGGFPLVASLCSGSIDEERMLVRPENESWAAPHPFPCCSEDLVWFRPYLLA